MATYQSKGFAIVPYAVMDTAPTNIKAQVFATYLVLHRRGWASEQGCWASVETIHADAGICSRAVRNALRWLVGEGWITREDRPGHTSLYRVRVEDPQPAKRSRKPQATTPPLADPTGVDPLQIGQGTPCRSDRGTPCRSAIRTRTPLTTTQEEDLPLTPSIALVPPLPPQGGEIDSVGSEQVESVADANRQPVTTTPNLPSCVEPHRELFLAWWRKRFALHPGAPDALDDRSIRAIEHAARCGVLEALLRDAIKTGPKSLGTGYRRKVAELMTPDTSGFDAFRDAYMAIQNKATNHSISKAITQYGRVLAQGITSEQLLAALRAGVRKQAETEQKRGWAAPFPDMMRWLRDDMWLAYVPRQAASSGSQVSAQHHSPSDASQGLSDDPFEAAQQMLAARRHLTAA